MDRQYENLFPPAVIGKKKRNWFTDRQSLQNYLVDALHENGNEYETILK